MTKREREILIKSVSWTDKSLTVNEEKAFQAGAKWADKTMIDRACKWMDYNLHLFVMKGHINHSALEQELRKAMEE